MPKASEVLEMLIPNGGWISVGQEYEGIQFLECEPITKEEFEAGFDKYDNWKIQQNLAAQAQKQEILDRIGLTEAEARLLLS